MNQKQPEITTTYADVNSKLTTGKPVSQQAFDARQSWQLPPVDILESQQLQEPKGDELFQQAKQLFIDKLNTKALSDAQYNRALNVGLQQLIIGYSESDAEEAAEELAESAFEALLSEVSKRECEGDDAFLMLLAEGGVSHSDMDGLTEEQRIAAAQAKGGEPEEESSPFSP